ncbi:MAG: hypothetical protein AABX07_03420 [Nanoarchaeota archaeon]
MTAHKTDLKPTLDRMYLGQINPLEAIREVDTLLGGITGVTYRQGLTLQNHMQRVSLNTRGLRRKEEEKLEEFVALAYWKAQRNGSCFPGEAHIEKGLSSKHYAQAFRNYIQNTLRKYNN